MSLRVTLNRISLSTLLITLLITLSLALGWATAQETTQSPTPPLTSQPLEPVLEAPTELSEITARSATLEVVTSVDLACVVVYGTDDSFGQLALDQDMGSGAHRDHFVIMRNLEPDTDYRYRLQGSDAEGTFYAGEIMSFRTPPAEEQADLGVNVATAERGARITAASSEFGSSFGAENAIDGASGTEWSSAGDGDEAHITVELSQSVAFSGFGLWTRTMGTSAQINHFKVENEVGETFGPFELPNASGLYRFEAEGEGQRFTFKVVDSSGGNTGIVELAVYQAEAQ